MNKGKNKMPYSAPEMEAMEAQVWSVICQSQGNTTGIFDEGGSLPEFE